MKPVFLAFLLLSAPACAWRWRSAADPLALPRKSFEAGNYKQVLSSLDAPALQKLRGRNLRQAYLYLAESHEHLGAPDQALGVYQLAVKLYPNDAELLTRSARLLHAADLDEQAQPLFEEVLSLDPENELANLGLAEIDHALGFLDRSAERYEKALGKELVGQAYIWRDYAEVLLKLRDYPTAEAAARKALGLSPDTASFITLALIHRAQGRGLEAVAVLKKLEQTAPIRRMEALWLLEEGRHDLSAPLAAGLLQDNPRDALALHISARLHLKAGRRAAAVKDLKAAASEAKNSPFVAKVSAEMLKSIQP